MGLRGSVTARWVLANTILASRSGTGTGGVVWVAREVFLGVLDVDWEHLLLDSSGPVPVRAYRRSLLRWRNDPVNPP